MKHLVLRPKRGCICPILFLSISYYLTSYPVWAADRGGIQPVRGSVSDSDHEKLDVADKGAHWFGRISIMDRLAPVPRDTTGQATLTANTPGAPAQLSHDFVLVNNASRALAITKFASKSDCIKVEINPPSSQYFPYVVPPSSKLNVKVTIDLTKCKNGKQDHRIDIIGNDQKRVLATLGMHGFIDNGVSFGVKSVEDTIRMPSGTVGMRTERTIRMTLDARLPTYLLPQTSLRLVTTDPSVEVSLLSTKPLQLPENRITERDDVIIDGDTITFARFDTPLKKDCVLVYRIRITKEAPPGILRAFLVLATDTKSPYVAFGEMAFPVEGLVRSNP